MPQEPGELMPLTKVKSSQLYAVGYKAKIGGEVLFHATACKARLDEKCTCEGGGRYQYPDMTLEQYKTLMKKKSKGKYFYATVRNQRFIKIHD